MSAINRQIRLWRRQLFWKGGFRRSDRDELEAHLREEVNRLIHEGYSEGEALQAALRNIGDTESLSAEYYKINFGEIWGKRLLIAALVLFGLWGMLAQYPGGVPLRPVATLDSGGVIDGTNFFVEFRQKPYRPLTLPNTGTERPQFFDLWAGDQVYTGLVLQREDHDLLYIDSNGDRDLTNDGAPRVFPLSQNDFSLRLLRDSSQNNFVEMILRRSPASTDPKTLSRVFDQNGDLLPSFVAYAKMYPEYSGEKRSYYFGSRVQIQAGTVALGEESYKIALFDWNMNGRYDDADHDLLLVDVDRNGKLGLYTNFGTFKLREVFRIDGKNYYIEHVDPLGKSVKIEQTDRPESFDFLKFLETRFGNSPRYSGAPVQLPAGFWDQKYIAINNHPVELSTFRGKYLFVAFRDISAEFDDFWGELYVLKKVREVFPPDQLGMVIFVALNERTSMQLVAELTQLATVVPLTDSVRSYFDLSVDFSERVSFENFLISPDGKAMQTNRPVDRWFFHKRIQ